MRIIRTDFIMGTLTALKKATKPYIDPTEKGKDYSTYLTRPIGFIQDVLKTTLTKEQCDIAESVVHNPITNVQSSHGIGKTRLSADIALYWVLAVQGLCITSAPTARQVKELLWSEIRKAISAHSLPLRSGMLFAELSEEARAFGFTARDSDSNSFQGVHSDKLLIIFDEACGISQEIWDGAEACITGSNNRMLTIGNPVVPNTPFHKACKESCIKIPAWSHPNVNYAYELYSDGIHRLIPNIERKPDLIPGAISIDWIERARKRGERSPFWLTRVEAEFSDAAGASIIPSNWFEEARQRYDSDPEHWDDLASEWDWAHGADVGDGGDDHGLARWRGPVLYFVNSIPTLGDRQDTTRFARDLIADHRRMGGLIAVDTIGVGAGTLATILDEKIPAISINWGSASSDPENYLNLKAEQYWTLAEQWDTIVIAPLGEHEETLKDEFNSIYYEETSKGQIRIEDKEKTRKRLGRSPNCADAVVYGYFCRRKRERKPRRQIPRESSRLLRKYL